MKPAPTQETWRLTDLFPDDEAFEGSREALRSTLPSLESWKGRLAESASTLAEALDAIDDARRRLSLLRCYASLRADTDTRVAACQEMNQSVEVLVTEFLGRISWVRPEILSIPPDTLAGFTADEPRLEPHAFFLSDLDRTRRHVLDPPAERILAESSRLTGSCASLFEVFHNAELPRPQVKLADGETIRLTPVNHLRLRTSRDREQRMATVPAFFSAYEAFRETLGRNLYGQVKAHVFQARVRDYPSCLAAALDPGAIPESVYENLIRQTRRRLPMLHRYLRLRARALGLDRLEVPDLHCPIVETPPRSFSTEQARGLVLDGLAPLGDGYLGVLREAFAQRWIDWHPTPGKRSGAYSNGAAYGVHPYVLLNYIGNIDGVSTLAHELGHAVHSNMSNRSQPYATASYAIFVAEVASTLNEMLLGDRMIETASSDAERAFLLTNRMDTVRTTLYRQVLFAEFEFDIHRRVERGEVLTGEKLGGIYLELLRDYLGHAEGVTRVGDEYSVEWAAVPHFYYGFYVYQYATGIVAATALAAAISAGEPGSVERYLRFLGSGGSDHPLSLLRGAGVDLESADPYDSAFGSFESNLTELERLLG